MSSPPHEFAGPVLRRPDGLRQHYLPVPPDVAEHYTQGPTRRILATFNGQTFRRAIQNSRDGEYFVLLSRDLLRQIGADYGDTVIVHLVEDPDPDDIELGEEFEAVLDQDEAAAARFYGMTPGRQRSLAYYVTSAKRTETRVKRALELAHKLRTYTLHGDTKPEVE